jgi:hypothetical protein
MGSATTSGLTGTPDWNISRHFHDALTRRLLAHFDAARNTRNHPIGARDLDETG